MKTYENMRSLESLSEQTNYSNGLDRRRYIEVGSFFIRYVVRLLQRRPLKKTVRIINEFGGLTARRNIHRRTYSSTVPQWQATQAQNRVNGGLRRITVRGITLDNVYQTQCKINV